MASSTPAVPGGEIRPFTASLFVLPVLNGIMHIPPAIGAIWTALGRRDIFEPPVLLLLFALHVLIDVADKYSDLPAATKRDLSTRIAVFAGIFMGQAAYATYVCGVMTLLRLLFVPAMAIVHGNALIPVWAVKESKLRFIKLKDVLGPFKSAFGALCIGLMDTKIIAQHACTVQPGSCSSDVSNVHQTQALAYTILYDFLLETVFDIRDMDEDRRNQVMTLPLALGLEQTVVLLAVVTTLTDVLVTGFTLDVRQVAECIFRSLLAWATCTHIALKSPRTDPAPWGLLTTIGLVPAWWAQARLLQPSTLSIMLVSLEQ